MRVESPRSNPRFFLAFFRHSGFGQRYAPPCKDRLVHYYETFGFRSEGVSDSTHGGVVWYAMRLTF